MDKSTLVSPASSNGQVPNWWFYAGIPITVVILAFGFVWPELFEALSVILMLAISFVCWQIFQIRREPGDKLLQGTGRIWLLLALGFGYLVLDEALSIHENIDRLIHWLFSIQPTNVTDRIDDVIVLIYGIAGIVLLYIHRVEFKSVSGYLPFFVLGFLLLVVMVVLDVGTNRKDVLNYLGITRSWIPSVKYVLEGGEELAKLLAEVAFLYGFVRIRQQFEARQVAPKTAK